MASVQYILIDFQVSSVSFTSHSISHSFSFPRLLQAGSLETAHWDASRSLGREGLAELSKVTSRIRAGRARACLVMCPSIPSGGWHWFSQAAGSSGFPLHPPLGFLVWVWVFFFFLVLIPPSGRGKSTAVVWVVNTLPALCKGGDEIMSGRACLTVYLTLICRGWV